MPLDQGVRDASNTGDEAADGENFCGIKLRSRRRQKALNMQN